MATITSYSTLKDAVAGGSAKWGKRSDMLSEFDTFLLLTEESMYRGDGARDGIRVRDMITTDTDTLSTSVRTLALPTGYLEFKKLSIQYSGTYYPPLQWRSAHEMYIYDSAGRPCYYTVTSQMEFDRVADVAYTLDRVYYAKLTAVSSSNSSNAILTRFPSVYLYGCLYHAFKWALNDEQASRYYDLFFNAIETATATDKEGQIGPSPQMTYHGSVA